MDPNANLREQVRLAKRLANTENSREDAAVDAARLAELVLALNEWIVKGGYLPLAWKGEIRRDRLIS